MKKVNEITVLEENDKCALDEYSAQLEKDITQKFKDEKYNDTKIKQDILDIQQEQTEQNTELKTLETDNTTNKQNILDIQQEQTQQNTKIETNSTEIATLKAEKERLKQENKDFKNALPSRTS